MVLRPQQPFWQGLDVVHLFHFGNSSEKGEYCGREKQSAIPRRQLILSGSYSSLRAESAELPGSLRLNAVRTRWPTISISIRRFGPDVTAFMLGYFVTSPFFGYLGDRLSRKAHCGGNLCLEHRDGFDRVCPRVFHPVMVSAGARWHLQGPVATSRQRVPRITGWKTRGQTRSKPSRCSRQRFPPH